MNDTTKTKTNDVSIIAAFCENHKMTRAEAENEASRQGMPLTEYCEMVVASDAVQTASTQFIGMAFSLRHPELHPVEVLRMAQQSVADIWDTPSRDGPLRSFLANALGHTATQASLIISETLAKED